MVIKKFVKKEKKKIVDSKLKRWWGLKDIYNNERRRRGGEEEGEGGRERERERERRCGFKGWKGLLGAIMGVSYREVEMIGNLLF